MSKSGKYNRIKQIWSFVKPFKSSFIAVFICILSTSLIDVIRPYIFGMLIDEVFYHRNMDFFKVIVVSFAVLYIGEASLYAVQNSLWAYLMTRFLFNIRLKLFERISLLRANYLTNAQTGELITRINQDTEHFVNLIFWNTFHLLVYIVNIVIIAVFVAKINIKVALLMYLITPITVLIMLYFGKKVRKNVDTYRGKYGKYISWAYEVISGLREVKIFASERYIDKSFVRFQSQLIRLKIKTSIIDFISERFNSFMALISDLSLYILASILIFLGEITVGKFIAFIEYFSKSKSLLQDIRNSYINIQSNMVAIDKVFGLLQEEIEEDGKGAIETDISNGEIELVNVMFKYNENSEILKKLNMKINKGEKISLVGKSGSGKSTLANLLIRLYKPNSGIINIDGVNVENYSLKSLRKNIGVVQQDVLLFDGTIKYNLILGNPKSSDNQIWEACEKAHIADFIKSLPNGMDTLIGVDGINLSGGQKQRISIARIFLKNPKIIIFDEATSALDYEAEQAVQKAWKELSVGRTTIIIAHRLSTILDSDRVAVLHEGQIVSCEHHLKLLETCEYYRLLFKEQYIGQEEVAV